MVIGLGRHPRREGGRWVKLGWGEAVPLQLSPGSGAGRMSPRRFWEVPSTVKSHLPLLRAAVPIYSLAHLRSSQQAWRAGWPRPGRNSLLLNPSKVLCGLCRDGAGWWWASRDLPPCHLDISVQGLRPTLGWCLQSSTSFFLPSGVS